MKILAIGDPHGNLNKIKKIPFTKIDLILITGDLGKADLARERYFKNIERKKGGLAEIEKDAKFIKKAHNEIFSSTLKVLKYLSKFAPVYTIEGNAGLPSSSEIKKENKKYKISLKPTKNEISKIPNIKIIKNSLRVIKGLRIGFLEFFIDSGWVKKFKPADYKKTEEIAKKETNKAKRILKKFNELDILICHQPPYGFLDKVTFKQAPKFWRGKFAGSKIILDYIRKKQPKYVFCGHIHEGKGKTKINNTEIYNLGIAGWKIIEI